MSNRKGIFVLPVMLLLIILAIGALTVQALADEISPAASDEMPFYIGEVRYATLQEAIDAAAYGDTISITSKTVRLDAELQIEADKDITLAAAGDAASSGVTIFSAEGGRHIQIYRSVNIKLKFRGVTLDGGDISGGIYSRANALTLDGAVIRNCSWSSGGGLELSITRSANVTIVGCTFIDNTAKDNGGAIFFAEGSHKIVDSKLTGNTARSGGGIDIFNGNLEIENSIISGNIAANSETSAGYGGAIRQSGGICVIKENSVISDNSAHFGGGIYSDGDSLTVKNSVINNNTAYSHGGMFVRGGTLVMRETSIGANTSRVGSGGGLYVYDSANFTIDNCSITGNSTGDFSDNTLSYGGGMYIAGSTTGTIIDSEISNNTAEDYGGGICNERSSIVLENCMVSGNRAGDIGSSLYGEGGGIHCTGGTLVIRDSYISNNTASEFGGGLYLFNYADVAIADSTISNNTASEFGGGIYSKYYTTSTITDCTISGNTSYRHGGGLYLTNSSATITSCEISNNSADVSGGGIFVESARYEGLNINSGTKFYGNSAAVLYEPPQDADTLYPNIKYASISPPIFDHPLNNYDISYTSSTPYYHMIFDAGPGGEVTTGTSGFYAEGSEIEIEAEAFEGFVFGRWGMDADKEVDTENSFADILSANTSVTVPSCNATVTAYFLELDYDNHFAYIIGYPDGNIKPSSNITRAETATIFFRLLTLDSRALLWSQTNEYKDVVSTDWHNNAVSTLTYGGILTGDPDKNFRPNSNITRGELAAIAARFSSAKYDGEDLFDDIEGHWAAKYINIAASQGWVEGYGDRIYSPDRYITRAEVATLVNRVLRRLPERADDLHGDMQIWPDNMDTTKWYYIAIQEATNSHNYERKADGIYEAWISMREAPDWHKLQNPDSKPGDVSY